MRLGGLGLLASVGVVVILLWTGCTCDPIYPEEPAVGKSCETIGDRDCGPGRDEVEPLSVLLCVETSQWAVEVRCDDFGMECTTSEEPPVCEPRDCTLGETRCTTDYTQVIECSAALEWTPSVECDKDTVCAVVDGVAACGEPRCREGDTRCSEDAKQIETCDTEGEWTVTESCGRDALCEVPTLVAICVVIPCTEGDTRCSEDDAAVETCDAADTWVATETCGPTQACEVRAEEALCVESVDPCTEGDTQCSDDETQVETCNAIGAWVVTETCGPTEACTVEADVAGCVEAVLPCTAGTELVQRCNPEDPIWIQECQDTSGSGDPVYEWVNVQDCTMFALDYVCQQEGDDEPFCLPAL